MSDYVRGAAFPRQYPMVVVDVTDGDTVRAFLDRGGDDWWLTKVRLAGIACRERAEPGGPEAAAHTRGVVASMTPPTVASMLDPRWQGTCLAKSWDKYAGRILGVVYLRDQTVDVSTLILRAGFAAAWDGRGAQPKPPWPIERTP